MTPAMSVRVCSNCSKSIRWFDSMMCCPPGRVCNKMENMSKVDEMQGFCNVLCHRFGIFFYQNRVVPIHDHWTPCIVCGHVIAVITKTACHCYALLVRLLRMVVQDWVSRATSQSIENWIAPSARRKIRIKN